MNWIEYSIHQITMCLCKQLDMQGIKWTIRIISMHFTQMISMIPISSFLFIPITSLHAYTVLQFICVVRKWSFVIAELADCWICMVSASSTAVLLKCLQHTMITVWLISILCAWILSKKSGYRWYLVNFELEECRFLFVKSIFCLFIIRLLNVF